jgi:dTMP kinase
MTYHARLVGPMGQVYHCEHNHRTETAAVTCANSSATRRMAEVAWQRSAAQAARAAASAARRRQEQADAQARRAAERQAELQRQAAARAAAERAKAERRAAKLAAMPPRRAWKLMTDEERLLKTAKLELDLYGIVVSPEASAAYNKQRGNADPATSASPSARPDTPVSPAHRAGETDGEPWWKQPGLRT